MNRTQKTRRQRHLRRAGHVRRVEFVLGDLDRDETIAAYLNSLSPGDRSEFIRQTLYAAITGQGAPPVPEAAPEVDSPGEAFNVAMAELDAKIRILQQLAEAIGQQPAANSPPEPVPGVTESSGLDLSRPRRRSTRPRSLAPTQNAPPEPDFDPEASRRLLLESIKGFGRNHGP